MWQSQADTYFDPVLRDYAALCAADPTCSLRMGADPVAKIQSVYAALDAGHCQAAGIDHATLRQILGGSLIGWHAKVFAFAVPYRLDRCTPEDVAALQSFSALWFSPYPNEGFSRALEGRSTSRRCPRPSGLTPASPC